MDQVIPRSVGDNVNHMLSMIPSNLKIKNAMFSLKKDSAFAYKL